MPGSDAGSDVVKPASSFVIQNRQTLCSIKVTKIYSLQPDANISVLKFLLSAASVSLILLTVAYRQGCHNVLISKICPFFEGLCLRKYFCPYF